MLSGSELGWDVTTLRMVIVESILISISIFCYYHFFFRDRNFRPGEINRKIQPAAVSCCRNPDCIRCRRYVYVQERARQKLSWILRDLKARDPSAFSKLNQRIPNAILRPEAISYIDNGGSGNGNNNQPSSFQNPTVLMVPDLPSREIVTDWHQNVCVYLKERQTRVKIFEALQNFGYNKSNSDVDYVSSDDSNWTVNDSSPNGDWKVFHILNQGVWNPILLSGNDEEKESYQKLLELVRNIPGLLKNCLFGNVFISKIYPGTNIEPHCGPTNIRHRLQFLLKLPDDLSSSTLSSYSSAAERKNTDRFGCHKPPILSLSVGLKEDLFWDVNNDIFVFDDSFVHSVTYRDEEARMINPGAANIKKKSKSENLHNENDLARTVLIVDLWHPNLQEMEIMLLQHSYPPFTSFT
mmetsp:Transcript_27135/g.59718  ORF Transcript_27135/g.59718 Transcript_27135/m.59718 type:complete len:410 (+) Transcript_27135:224-1453(+)